jgi:phage shock protein A
MQVLERIGRMLRADAHGVIDQIEEKRLLLKQHLREAEIEIAHKRGTLDGLDEERLRIFDQGRRLEAEVARLDEDIEIARKGDDPDLSRFAVRRWLPKRDALRQLQAHARQLDERRARLSAKLESQEAELAALRPRVRAAMTRPSRDCDPPLQEPSVTDEEVELELLRRLEHAADVDSESAADGGASR